MGLLNQEDRSYQGGSSFDPPAGEPVTLKKFWFEENSKGDNTWVNIMVDMDWAGMPDDFKPRMIMASNAEFEKKTILTRSWPRNSYAERFIGSLAAAIDVAGVDIEDSNDISMFDGLVVEMKMVPEPSGKKRKYTTKDGEDKETAIMEMCVTKVLEAPKAGKSGKKATKPAAELSQEAKDAVDAAIADGIDTMPKLIRHLKDAKIEFGEAKALKEYAGL